MHVHEISKPVFKFKCYTFLLFENMYEYMSVHNKGAKIASTYHFNIFIFQYCNPPDLHFFITVS